MNEKPTIMELAALRLFGTSVAEQRIQQRIKAEQDKRKANQDQRKKGKN